MKIKRIISGCMVVFAVSCLVIICNVSNSVAQADGKVTVKVCPGSGVQCTNALGEVLTKGKDNGEIEIVIEVTDNSTQP